MEGVTFRKKNSNIQLGRVDRFVPRRDTLNKPRRPISSPDRQDEDADIWIPKHWYRKNYGDSLDKVFGLEQDSEKYVVQPWPCVPRKKSYLTSADSILDLPTYSHADFPQLLDWSRDNVLVAALGKNYHKWSWGSQNLTGKGKANYEIRSCKFDPRGELLLLGTDMKTAEVHDNINSKCISMINCHCNKLQQFPCGITAVDWSPTGNSYVTGCTAGVIASFTRSSLPISWTKPFRKPIFSVQVSPDARFAAVISVNSTQVVLLSWPYLEMTSRLMFKKIYHLNIDWHPWRSALLAIGAVTTDFETSVLICDAPTSKLEKWTLGGTKRCLDALRFSNKTGELVLSLFNTERGLLYPKSSSQLLVLSNPDTVVDQWCDDGRTGLARVKTMVFGPNGTKLATATTDEDLIIWNFLPESKKGKKERKLKRFSAIPAYLDQVTQGYALR